MPIVKDCSRAAGTLNQLINSDSKRGGVVGDGLLESARLHRQPIGHNSSLRNLPIPSQVLNCKTVALSDTFSLEAGKKAWQEIK